MATTKLDEEKKLQTELNNTNPKSSPAQSQNLNTAGTVQKNTQSATPANSVLGNVAVPAPTKPTYNAKYDSQINDLMNQMNNRQPFSYDVNKDILYEQYKDQYIKTGKLAMQDTIGQASAMTGGYGNSWAQNAGQAAYNASLGELNDIIPQLYSMAYDRYNQEGQDLLNRYNMLSDRENQEYGRYMDAVNDYYAERDFAYGKERDEIADRQWQQSFDYGKEQDAIANNQWQQSFDRSVLESDREYNYQMGRDQINDQRYENEFAYQKEQDAIANNQWQQQFDRGVLESDREYDYMLGRDAIDDQRYTEEMEYRKYLDEIERQQWQDSFDHMQDQDWIDDRQWQAEFEQRKEQNDIANRQWEKQFNAEYGKKDDKASGNVNEDVKQVALNGTVPFSEEKFAEFNKTEWSEYFNLIRLNKGESAALDELERLASSGLLPTEMATVAAIAARGGMKGH